MKITVEIAEERVAALVKERIAELFSSDSRYRETGVRNLVRGIVDDAAVSAVRTARDAVTAELPAMANEAVRHALQNEIELAAKRGFGALRKLYAGFDPNKLTTDQRAWLEKQIANAGKETQEKK